MANQPKIDTTNSCFDEAALRHLRKICSVPAFIGQIEDIASTYYEDMGVIGKRRSFTERMRCLDKLERRAKRLLESLDNSDASDALGGWGGRWNKLRNELKALQNAVDEAPGRRSRLQGVNMQHCSGLMVDKLAMVFRKHRLRVSRAESSYFVRCVKIVREAAGYSLGDTRAYLRTLPDIIFTGDNGTKSIPEGSLVCKECGRWFTEKTSVAGDKGFCGANCLHSSTY